MGWRLYFLSAEKNGVSKRSGDAAHDVQMAFDVVGLAIENASEGARVARRVGLDRHIGHQVEIQLRAQALYDVAQDHAEIGGGHVFQVDRLHAREVTIKKLQIALRMETEPGPKDAGLDVRIDQYGGDRVLKARHHDDVVGKLVLGPSAHCGRNCG